VRALSSRDWKREEESRSLALCRLNPQSSTMLFDDAFDDGKADSSPSVLASPMQASKYFEDLIVICRIDADAIVFHRKEP
jgi:hypothetical protein